MKIYVASSWRNESQPHVVSTLRSAGFHVYNFREPEEGNSGFHWSEIGPDWQSWSPEKLRDGLKHPIAQSGFNLDKQALDSSDVCVLVLPCGRSAHLEAGYIAGQGKRVFVLLSDGEPELMYGLTTELCLCLGEVIDKLVETPNAD